MGFVYILQSQKYAKTYVGSTDNVDRRLEEHNNGKSVFTSKYKPWRLIYKEELPTLLAARLREKYFKSAAGRRYMREYIIPR